MLPVNPLNEPLRNWLADRFEDFKEQLANSDDPAVLFEVNGVTMEVRLMNCPGEFTREPIEV